MKIAFATMPRSGSEFLVELTRAVMGAAWPGEVLSVTPGRMVGPSTARLPVLKEHMDRGEGLRFFRERAIECAKLESPGQDTLCFELAEAFPRLRWLTSLRRIEKVISSHHNIKGWGWPEERVLVAYLHDIVFLEHLAARGKLLVVNVEEPRWFNLDKMVGFLGCDRAGPDAAELIREWPVVNPLRRQQELGGQDAEPPAPPPGLETLRERHPWLADIDARYRRLWERSIG